MTVHFIFKVALVHALLQAPPAARHWDFSGDRIGGLPQGWETRGDSRTPVYHVAAEPDGNRVLSASSRGSDVQLGVEISERTADFPILSWRWRVKQLPDGADERKTKALDSGASVYAVFGSRLFPRILKYVWSTSVPAGSSFKHPSSGRVAVIVIESGTAFLGQWRDVRRDLVLDYQTAFGSRPSNLIAIGIKTDSDSTGTSAQADYDDIQLTRRQGDSGKEQL